MADSPPVAEPPAPEPPALELAGIHKRFGAVVANRDVSFAVAKGSIHGLVGENGAGKSTVMNIAYGYLHADSGVILIDGRVHRSRSPADALAAGIGMVHQHFMLVDTFTAVENVLLGAEGGMGLGRGTARVRQRLDALSRTYGLGVDCESPVAELAVGERQRLEILKALVRGAEILILDEPTAVLTPVETAQLFRLLRILRDEGKTIILISHKLGEIMDITDRVTVMRRGRVVATMDTASTSAEGLAEMMVGQPMALEQPRPCAAFAADRPAPVLSAKGLRVSDDRGRETVRGVDLHLHAGEIVGVAGVSGNGQSELLEALAGMRSPSGGTVHLKGALLVDPTTRYTPAQARALGIAHVPEDRLAVGVVPAFPAVMAAILGYHRDRRWCRLGVLLWQRVRTTCAELMGRYDIRPPAPDLAVAMFSGGNQQKLVMAREVECQPDVLLVGQPTRGVDVGAVAFIHQQLDNLRRSGKAILIVSAELDELLALADRILVMSGGRIVGETTPAAADPRQLGVMMGTS